MNPHRTTPEFTTRVASPDVVVVGAVAHGEAVERWARRLMAEPADVLRTLRVARFETALVVLGDPLPWVDGLTYLRACEGDASILLPTTARLSVPEALFARALRTDHPALPSLLAVVPHTRELLPLGTTESLTLADLQEVVS